MNTTLPIVPANHVGDAIGRWWSSEPDGRIECHLCPRGCRLNPGDRGFCFVRINRDGQMVLDTYGRSTGFCIDPIEKKPLNHFLPGTPVLSFGTAGCNLGCKFCQNWDISKSREVARLSDMASPGDIAHAAVSSGCRSVAFTYNDPVIWAEYAIDTASECRRLGVKTVAVTAGYITPQARGEFFDSMDAANIDLKAFTESFYFKLTGAHLDPVLDTIRYVCNETDCWVELTNLVIPDANDSPDEFERMCDWILDAVGADVPVHFTAFHPDFRMTDREATTPEKLVQAYDVARQAGLRYVYIGNVHDIVRQSTYCPGCGQLLIERDWHQIGHYRLDGDQCRKCGYRIPGHFESQCGTWGRRRQPIRISQRPVVPTPAASTTKQEVVHMSTTTESKDVAVFSEEELARIHKTACRQVECAVENRACDTKSLLGDLAERKIAGVYVTLKRGETLRGCCGLQGPPVALADAIADAAIRTAKHDPRMAPIAAAELPYLTLSISILGPPRPIGAQGDDRINAVVVGRHGLRIRMTGKAGLLLPSVARDREWSSRQFLDAICSKAGLPPGSWRSDQAVLEVFDGIDYGDRFCCSESTDLADPCVVSRADLNRLASWTETNLASLLSGATPIYYASDVDDREVQGIVLRVFHDSDQPPTSWLHLSIRESLPLQSTLFQMTQNAASFLAQQAHTPQPKAEIGILSTIVHHGMAADYDLAGVDCNHRAVIAMDGRRWSVALDQSAEADDLLEEALAAQPFRRENTMIYSAHCDATESRFVISMGPLAQERISTRPPAVAGMFYPAEDAEREWLVDELLNGLPPVKPTTVEAAMVPHAGLRYSGRIAADVWRRIKMPESVLIIGPKHTADGVDWAVAPHDVWRLSADASMAGNVELAHQIAESVPGMQLDAAAHAREHGTEVQLPILYRIAPSVRVAAIAMAGATVEELEQAAGALAELLQSLDKPPLLVISSDMNHFADDVENRRRDRIALAALQRNDPRELLQRCAEENISMCGQIPAALVLLTLQAMGRQVNYREIGYATSGDVSGDLSRVVGYAGVLF